MGSANKYTWRLSVLVAAVALTGCTAGSHEDHDDGDPHSHFDHDHFVAEHRPDDLPDAAVKIRKFLSLAVDSNGKTQETIEKIRDVISWTPEIAADTDLSEQDWLPLFLSSESLGKKYVDRMSMISSDVSAQTLQFCDLIDEAVRKIPEPTTHPDAI
ncbi:hypothetical protein [Roseiconus lacunae]|uniref:hypothetical protein n=1 Tax=Roseiconus lacunae TaxID=2605694 RepID=UPI001E2B5097|nr:hypothetical protein [Roseiconus lacunae]